MFIQINTQKTRNKHNKQPERERESEIRKGRENTLLGKQSSIGIYG
jgi:hypothetical protein